MKRHKEILSYVIALTAVAAMFSCSSDDNGAGLPLAAPTITVDDAKTAANRLSLTWNKPDGAYEYFYTLQDSDGVLIDSVLTQKNIEHTYNTLLPGMEYTAKLTAYSNLADKTYAGQSEWTVVKAKLPAVDLTTSYDDEKIYATWTNIQGADYTNYTIKDSCRSTILSKDTVHNTKTISCSAEYMGKYLFSLTGLYADSQHVTLPNSEILFDNPNFTQVTGTAYLEGIGTTKTATMCINNDGSYTIKNWYGGDSDFSFSLDESGNLTPIGDESHTSKYAYYKTGRSQDEEDIDLVEIKMASSYALLKNMTSKAKNKLSRFHGKVVIKLTLLQNFNGDEMDPTSDDSSYTFTW